MKSTAIVARAYGDRTSATLNAILSRLGGSVYAKLILDGGDWIITENVTVLGNVVLDIYPDARIMVADGVTFEIVSPYCSYSRSRNDWAVLGSGATLTIPTAIAESTAAELVSGAQDLNLMTTGGTFFGITGDVVWSNCPVGVEASSAFLQVVRYTDNYVTQTFVVMALDKYQYTRILVEGSWSDWKSVQDATTTVAGIVALATLAAAKSGTSETKALTPAGLSHVFGEWTDFSANVKLYQGSERDATILVARILQVGKTVWANVAVKSKVAGATGSAIYITGFPQPKTGTAIAYANPIGSAILKRAGSPPYHYSGVAAYISSGSFGILRNYSTYNWLGATGDAIALQVDDTISMSLCYEVD